MTNHDMTYHASGASLVRLFAYLDDLGIPPVEIAPPGVIALVRQQGGSQVESRLLMKLFERAAIRCDDPLFGLRYAQNHEPTYGPLSLLWRYAPSVRYSNRITEKMLHLQHEGASVSARKEGDDSSFLIYRFHAEPGQDSRQFAEASVSLMLRVCRWIMGRDWIPQKVRFAHEPIAPVAHYSDIVNAPVEFGAAENGLLVFTEDLDRQSPEHDPEILAFVENSLLRLAKEYPLPFRERLDVVIDDLLALGNSRIKSVATAMMMSTRSLQRRLHAEQTYFSAVVAARRLQIVHAWSQRVPKTPLAVLAEHTGFSDASALSRFLRQHRTSG